MSWKLYLKLQMKGWFRCSIILLSRRMFLTLSERTTISSQRWPRCPTQHNSLSSFRMYFKANVRPVSFLSTMRTFPKAPFPTTLSNRKWLRFTVWVVSCCRYAMGWRKQLQRVYIIQHISMAGGKHIPSSVNTTGFPELLPILVTLVQRCLVKF